MSDNQSICVNCHSKIPESGLVCPFCRMDPRMYGSLPMNLGNPPQGVTGDEAGCATLVFGLIVFGLAGWFIWKVYSSTP